MSITFSLEEGVISRYDHARVIKSAESFFQTEKNKHEMPTQDITYDFVSRKFPYSLNIIKNNKKVIGHTFLLPCDEKNMEEFLSGRITERELFYNIRDRIKPEQYSSLYLAAAQVLPEFKRRGLATKAFVMQIRTYQRAIMEDLALFYWPLTREGEALAQKIAAITKLPIRTIKE